ncbi:MAG: hypothetical protein LBH09_03610 [Peptococcaceae bacterium]|nr:hypothetical protein [Peptococcaceae bacterium]
MKEKMSKFFFLVLAISLALSLFAASASALRTDLNVGTPADYREKYQGGDQYKSLAGNPQIAVLGDTSEAWVFWHFVNNTGDGTKIDMAFLAPDGSIVWVYGLKDYKNGQHYGVVTPPDWKLYDAKYEGDNGASPSKRLNLSHTELFNTKAGDTVNVPRGRLRVTKYVDGEIPVSSGDFVIMLESVDGGYSYSITLKAPDYFYAGHIRTGRYWITELSTPGSSYSFDRISGDGVSLVGGRYQLNLAAGGSRLYVENTFAGEDETLYGSAEVTKTVNGERPSPGDEMFAIRFVLTGSQGESYAFFLDSQEPYYTRQLPVGTYTITEDGRAGFVLDTVSVVIDKGSGGIETLNPYLGEPVMIEEGDSLSIAVNNRVEPAYVSINKNINDAPAQTGEFTVTLTRQGGSSIPFILNGGNGWSIIDEEIDPGVYTVAETEIPSGYRLSSIRVNGRQAPVGGFTVKSGDRLAIEVNNTSTSNQVIHISKTVNGFTPVSGTSYTVVLDRVGPGSPSSYTFPVLDSGNQFSAEINVAAGTYTIRELIPTGAGYWFEGFYIANGIEQLLDGDTITISSGQDIQIRVNNISAAVEMHKVVDGVHPEFDVGSFQVTLTKQGAEDPSYTFYLDYSTESSLRYIDAKTVEPGDYIIRETITDSQGNAYQIGGFDVVGEDGLRHYENGSLLSIQPGDMLTATANNMISDESAALVSIRKTIDGQPANAANAGSRTFTVMLTPYMTEGSPYIFILAADDWSASLSVDPGTYSLSEESTSGFTFKSFSGDGVDSADPGYRITVEVGGNYIINANNTKNTSGETEFEPDLKPDPDPEPEEEQEGDTETEEEEVTGGGEEERVVDDGGNGGTDNEDEEYTPGGRDQDIPPNPNVPGHGLIPDGDGWLELDEDGVPLGRWDWDDEEEEWIFDEFPPLGRLPQTAQNNGAPLYMYIPGILLIALGLTLRFTTDRKRQG